MTCCNFLCRLVPFAMQLSVFAIDFFVRLLCSGALATPLLSLCAMLWDFPLCFLLPDFAKEFHCRSLQSFCCNLDLAY